jgi:histidinol-phosphate aminotransferase
MYAMSAQFAGLQFVGVPLRADFTLDRAAMLSAMAAQQPAIIYLAYPNNPTGNLFDAADMEAIVRAAQGEVCNSLVVVDEAYQPFAQQSWMPRLAEFGNLLVMRTVSKLGLAGIRLGYLAGAPEWLAQLDKVRPPYNVNVLTEAAALFALEHVSVLDEQAAQLRAERARVADGMAAHPGVIVFPSAANFLLARVPDAAQTFDRLLARKVLIKNVSKMHPLLANCLRVTVSTPEENAQFLEAFAASLQD